MNNQENRCSAIRPRVAFEIRALEEGDSGYIQGYYSLACTAVVNSLRGSYIVALVSDEMRKAFCSQSYFKDEMQEKALQELIKTVRNERLRLRL